VVQDGRCGKKYLFAEFLSVLVGEIEFAGEIEFVAGDFLSQ
jgi:hypothetical protein